MRVVIDPISLPYLQGSLIDFKDGLMGAGFSFENPNVQSTCGCNSSFQAKPDDRGPVLAEARRLRLSAIQRSATVSDEQVEAFRRDGAVCVRGAFTAEEVALVERGIERNLAEPSPRALVASRPDDPGRFFEDFCNWDRIPEYEQFDPRVGRRRRSPAS